MKRIFVLAALAVSSSATQAQSQDPFLILACSVVPDLIQCPDGQRFDTQRCRCVAIKPGKMCAKVCVDGKLDVKRCKCVVTKTN
jgi:hypothetical protein